MPTLALSLDIKHDPRVFINERIWFEDLEDTRVVFIDGYLYFQYRVGGGADQTFLIGALALNGLAKVGDLARAFGVDPKTVYRQRKRVEAEGAVGALPRKPGAEGRLGARPRVLPDAQHRLGEVHIRRFEVKCLRDSRPPDLRPAKPCSIRGPGQLMRRK